MTTRVRQEEFAPWLGAVASPRPRPIVGELSLDRIRLALVGRLVEASRAPSPDWLAAWRVAVDEAAQLTLATLRHRAAAASGASRAPDRVARQAVPDQDDVRVIVARLASAGIPLERAVGMHPEGAAMGSRFSTIGGAVEESWLELEAMLGAILAEWAPRSEAVARWRRPVAVLWILTVTVLLVTMAAGLAIGGYLAAPRWFQPVVTWWWSLPWP